MPIAIRLDGFAFHFSRESTALSPYIAYSPPLVVCRFHRLNTCSPLMNPYVNVTLFSTSSIASLHSSSICAARLWFSSERWNPHSCPKWSTPIVTVSRALSMAYRLKRFSRSIQLDDFHCLTCVQSQYGYITAVYGRRGGPVRYTVK